MKVSVVVMWYGSKLAIASNTDTMRSGDTQDSFWLCNLLVMWRMQNSFKVATVCFANEDSSQHQQRKAVELHIWSDFSLVENIQ